MTTRQAAIQFFYKHAGYSWNPSTETKEAGRRRCARALAKAEADGANAGLSFEWEPDQISDSSDFSDEAPPWGLWVCVCSNDDGRAVASLGGVDFGRGGEPWGQSYRRVVEAELALGALGVEPVAA